MIQVAVGGLERMRQLELEVKERNTGYRNDWSDAAVTIAQWLLNNQSVDGILLYRCD